MFTTTGLLAAAVTTCDACGSANVYKRYTVDFSGEVDGQTLTCRDCGNSCTY